MNFTLQNAYTSLGSSMCVLQKQGKMAVEMLSDFINEVDMLSK